MLTTPCIGAAFFPGVIATVLGQHPRARISLSEHGWPGGELQLPADGLALALVPTFPAPPALEWHSTVLWREPMQALVPVDHELAQHAAGSGSVISADRLAGIPLVVGGTTSAEPEIATMLEARGLEMGAAPWWPPRRRWWPWFGPVSGSASAMRSASKVLIRQVLSRSTSTIQGWSGTFRCIGMMCC